MAVCDRPTATNPPQSPFEPACAAEVFGTATTDAPTRYDFRVCAERPGPLRTTAGYSMLVDTGLAALGELDTRLTIDRLAERAGVSGRNLARRFAEQLGTSPGQWLLRRRLDTARVLLEQTDLPVETVATRAGLVSAVNLSRRFRASFGTTPGAYRRSFDEIR